MAVTSIAPMKISAMIAHETIDVIVTLIDLTLTLIDLTDLTLTL